MSQKILFFRALSSKQLSLHGKCDHDLFTPRRHLTDFMLKQLTVLCILRSVL